ncbi:hypothetical protein Trihar35433_1365 [Trichoderma harzianum]|nr:hypothetical protein Trihar35433_1365 [Trichoderma harzianum]
MASESRLYNISGETKEHLRKFRLTTSRASKPQAVICMYVAVVSLSPVVMAVAARVMAMRRGLNIRWMLTAGSLKYIDLIDKTTHEIHQDADKVTYTSLDEIADDLPDHAPRFILLSYPLTMPDGRLSVPYVLLYYLPITCNAETRMLYAGAKELIRNTAEVNKVIDIESTEELEEVPTQLTT